MYVGVEIIYQFEIIFDDVIEITKCVIFLLPQYPQYHHTHVSYMWAALAQLYFAAVGCYIWLPRVVCLACKLQ
jgi:hypothetical protein